MPLVLVVDDEEHIQKLLHFTLSKEGFQVLVAADGPQALEMARQHRPDVIILDLMLPALDGFTVCELLRRDPSLKEIPVIVLSARGTEEDKVRGLDIGADDYVTKPFSPRELAARVKAQLRRRQSQAEREKLVYGPLVIDRERYAVAWKEHWQYLAPKEFELLYFLATHPGRVFSREQLLDQIWGYDYLGGPRTVDVHVRYIRQKLEQMPGAPQLIETVRGVGYRFREPAQW
ncbi:two component transcriptional regulator, winged helix family [Ammonifex degensii KC4]|uniref:Stage 0 sporulation protein A homolog n=1 Tax=Ammonifex degensii (strain DSM 10501 / KC4) TaxID=429009 RepID=C9RD17_AMMDK|nr:two component transcriptional regulator, winged helix family [Ammonifex degensii KC4]